MAFKRWVIILTGFRIWVERNTPVDIRNLIREVAAISTNQWIALLSSLEYHTLLWIISAEIMTVWTNCSSICLVAFIGGM